MTICSTQYAGVSYRKFLEPFSLDELYSADVSNAKHPESRRGINLPMIEDFSQVDLSLIDPSDITRYLMRVKNSGVISKDLAGSFVCCVAGDVGTFGMLRLYGVYAEIYGVRDEKFYHVSDSLAEATLWLMKSAGYSVEDAKEALDYFAKYSITSH